MSSIRVNGSLARIVIAAAMAAVAATIAMAIALAERGEASFPGLNGRIAYSLEDGETATIGSVNPDGSAPAKLSAGPQDYSPAYSPDGSRIAFNRSGGLFTMNADGSGLTQLATGGESFSSETTWDDNYKGDDGEIYPWVRIRTSVEEWSGFHNPSFSPDGSQIAVNEERANWAWDSICAVESFGDQVCSEGPGEYYEYFEECTDCWSHIITLSAATGAKLADVTPRSGSIEDYDPSFAADGRIAFSRWDKNRSAIYVAAAPGAPAVPLTSGPDDYNPDFSPDGTRIVFARIDNTLGIVGSGGGPVSVLTAPRPPGTEDSYVSRPTFSPDGTRIAFFQALSTSGDESAQGGVYTMAVDGSGMAKLVDKASSPAWQPVPPPPPPVAAKLVNSKKKKVKLDKKGKAVVGTIVCGSTPCTLKGLNADLLISAPKGAGKSVATASKTKKSGKGGKKGKAKSTYKVGLQVSKSLAPTKSSKVTVKVSGKALKALKGAGKGALTARVQVADGTARSVATIKVTLIPPTEKSKKPKGKKGGKGGK